MRWEQVFPYCSLALNIGSAIGYAWAHDWTKVTYWIGAGIINVSLLF